MKKKTAVLILFLFILSNAFAVVNTYYPYYPTVDYVQLNSDYSFGYNSSITARDGDAIDIKASVFVDYYYDVYPYYDTVYDPYDQIQVWTEVYGDGIYLKKTSVKTYYVYQLNYLEVNWNNAFYADDRYSSYEVVVYARSALDYSRKDWHSAFINQVLPRTDAFCSDIEIDNKTVAMNENTTKTISFTIRNNSEERFEIHNARIFGEDYFNTYLVSKDSSIAAGSTGEVRFRFETNEVNSDKTDSATLELEGEFYNGKNCSNIKEDFLVKIQNNAFQSCKDIVIIASNERMNENSTEYFSFKTKNYSDTSFYVDSFDVVETSSFFNAFETYKPTLIPGNSEKEFTYKVESENVSFDKEGTIRLRVSGHYSGGDHCSYSEIGEEIINLTVENDFFEGNCNDLVLNTRDLSMEENDFSSFYFSIKNNSGERFYIDSFNGVDFEESSPYLNFTGIDYSSYIPAYTERNVSFKINTENVSTDKIITAYFKVKGEFEDGRQCTFSDTQKRFNARINNKDFFESDCREINVLTRTVSLKEGETKNFDFEITNNANQKFYVDSVNVYDNASEINSSEYYYPSSVSENGTRTITAKITGNKTGTATVFIEVSGHYSGAEYCSASDIGRKNFTVRVNREESSCIDFSLNAPSIKSVLGKETITLNIDNPLNKRAEIRISGTNLSVSPYLIEVPANYTVTKTIEIELLEGTESFLVYDISIDRCNIKSETTKIISSTTAFEITGYPREKTIALEDSISFTLINNSGTSRKFNIFMIVPEELKANEKSIVIPAYSDRTVSLSIKAEKTGEYNTVLVVESLGKRSEKEIRLTATEDTEKIKVSAETTRSVLNELELKIVVDNQSKEEIQGNIIIELPEDWKLEGDTTIEVKEETKKEFVFALKTNGKEMEQDIPVKLELDNGKTINKIAEFKETGISTALISLAENAGAVIGLIIIIIIVVILVAKR